MSERSFDIIVEVSEGFLNRSLRHLFESSAIPSVYEGEHSIPAPQLLKAYSELKYKIRLSEPLHVDAVKDEMINISFGADVNLFFTLFMIEANVRGIVESKPVYDRGKTQLELNIKGIKLTSIGARGPSLIPFNTDISISG